MLAAAAGSPNLMLQATIFLGAALLFVPLGKRFGIATVLGYLITGLILGPSGFRRRRELIALFRVRRGHAVVYHWS